MYFELIKNLLFDSLMYIPVLLLKQVPLIILDNLILLILLFILKDIHSDISFAK